MYFNPNSNNKAPLFTNHRSFLWFDDFRYCLQNGFLIWALLYQRSVNLKNNFFLKLNCPKNERNFRQNSVLWTNWVSRKNASEIYWPLHNLETGGLFDVRFAHGWRYQFAARPDASVVGPLHNGFRIFLKLHLNSCKLII